MLSDDFNRNPEKAVLTISLDVIYHLIEDKVFEEYVRTLLNSSEKYCIIYACNDEVASKASHVRGRNFVDYIKRNFKDWELFAIRYNDFPYSELRDGSNSSISDFYFYRRK